PAGRQASGQRPGVPGCEIHTKNQRDDLARSQALRYDRLSRGHPMKHSASGPGTRKSRRRDTPPTASERQHGVFTGTVALVASVAVLTSEGSTAAPESERSAASGQAAAAAGPVADPQAEIERLR